MFADIRLLGWRKFNGDHNVKVTPGLREEKFQPPDFSTIYNLAFLRQGAEITDGEYARL
jgi:hypothetical protein